jgi:hypothetical protein
MIQRTLPPQRPLSRLALSFSMVAQVTLLDPVVPLVALAFVTLGLTLQKIAVAGDSLPPLAGALPIHLRLLLTAIGRILMRALRVVGIQRPHALRVTGMTRIARACALRRGRRSGRRGGRGAQPRLAENAVGAAHDFGESERRNGKTGENNESSDQQHFGCYQRASAY